MRIVNMADWPLDPADEAPHEPGGDLLWNESYYLDFTSTDGELGGYLRLGLYPNWNKTWFWACLVTRDGHLTALTDHDAHAEGLEVTGHGYRGTLETAAPMETARATLAAHGLELDLEWHTEGGAYGYSLVPRYEVPCRVSGTINGTTFEGYGERDHSWGVRDWWSLSWLWSSCRLDDGTHLHGMQANLGAPLPWPAFAVPPGGKIEHVEGFSAEAGFDGSRPESATLRFPGLVTEVTPIAFAPVTLTAPDGRIADFPRAMCRYATEDGRTGYGWTEWHQPPGWRTHGWHPLI
jgi:hypothetical protein